MIKIHNLGFPRIGALRELKFAQEAYWKREKSEEELLEVAKNIRQKNWEIQKNLDFIPVLDFSLYDQVLDMSQTLGNLPKRVKDLSGDDLDSYFRAARGRSPKDGNSTGVFASEMVKWFNSNYHYLVPEFSADSEFSLNPLRILAEIEEAKDRGINFKPVIIGPISYLWLGKVKDESEKLNLLEKLLPVYEKLLEEISKAGASWLQIDEPALVMELEPKWREAFNFAYEKLLAKTELKILLATYFSNLGKEAFNLVKGLNFDALHIDVLNTSEQEIKEIIDNFPNILSLGVIDGRNIWKADLNKLLDKLEPLVKDREIWLAPSSSLLHTPVDLEIEENLDPEIKSWLSFATQKLEELRILKEALNKGRSAVEKELRENQKALESRKNSKRVHNPAVKERVKNIQAEMTKRNSPYQKRAEIQREHLKLPLFPTTTIGSFPQTAEIRKARSDFRKGILSEEQYISAIKNEIKHCIDIQQLLDIDVLVHGEAERNDMVEYFGEQLEGYVFTRFAWVQSYGSRCVKPPIIFGDVSRPRAMTVEWSKYAKSLTSRPMKGMLTGPTTILNWSFVRDDQSREETCLQIALAVRDEVIDLEEAGISAIQIDEPAIREGLPLKKANWQEYLNWAVKAFKVATSGVRDETQIHTHMCYSEFNDIMEAIAALDADVITIETSRSDMKLLEAFKNFDYPNEIGPGVYDIHSPNIPSVENMVALIEKAAKNIPAERLWVNPDCGLKTRQWSEVKPALENMVKAAKELRGKFTI